MNENRLKQLKAFDEEEREVDFKFEKSSDDDKNYYGLSNFELVKSVFAHNICSKCDNNLSKEDLEINNYQLWINDRQSFLNLDDYNPENRTKLEVVFHIKKVSHKSCPKKIYKNDNRSDIADTMYEDNKEIIPQEFLKDKEH